ncbi:MAG: Type 1 glutamine amidotransferase-like domain-containing protein [bacterium]|nr:Type 1 glutamine amidotransferase-like domain-containing protein [bacterium]
MKFLLTSGGISNKTIEKSFFDLAGKPKEEIKVAYIPTAANVETGDKWWMIKDLVDLKNMELGQIDIVDISALQKKMMIERLKEANVFFIEGGNTFYLMHWIKKSGLIELLPDLLKTRVWVGVSAGSMAVGRGILNDEDRQIAKDILGEDVGTEGLGYVDFSIKPHYLSPLFEGRDKASVAKEAEQFEEPMYALDDHSAVVVDGDKVKVVSEGKWEKFE